MDRGCRHLLCHSQNFIDVQISFRFPNPNGLITSGRGALRRQHRCKWQRMEYFLRSVAATDTRFLPIGDEHLHDSQLGFRFRGMQQVLLALFR